MGWESTAMGDIAAVKSNGGFCHSIGKTARPRAGVSLSTVASLEQQQFSISAVA